MSPAEQRAREDLAVVLDTWLAIVAIELANEERLTQPTPTRVTPAMLQQKLRIRRRELLRKAS